MKNAIPRVILTVTLFSFASLTLAASTSPGNSWQSKAQSVCTQLQTATTAYQNKDLKQAHLNAVMAYFQNYDLNIEPTARLQFPQGHIFDIEQRFSTLNKSMVDNPSPTDLNAIQQQSQQLCQIITDDAKQMDKTSIKSVTGEN